MVSPYGERVLDVVERIPSGQVMAYGDIAEYLGEGGPRQVGTVMSTWGGGVPWWRVVHADGTAAAGLLDRALAHWREEDTPLRGEKVDMRRARWLPSGDFQEPTDLA
ncbi:MGMT family protein [Nonomuraea recticatena]|uniref:Methylated-DNA-[protein]-cysteine S-methyltransferase DNA binding domain-containing protein n=1 Tax=Nonomuraea recticatena TaxID=46178 RepID=A0ABN3RGP1_9ACTN